MKLFLGVDGGQSSTRAWIGDESGAVLGTGKGAPVEHVGALEGRAKFSAALSESVALAADHAGISSPTFEAAVFGFSGGPDDKEAVTREIVAASKYAFAHDASIALSGALAGEPGVVVIAGTGSMAFARDAGGKTARAGGWGYIFGDEGGAFDMVRQALRAILRHEEGWGPPTRLRDALLTATQAESANELLHRFYTADYPRSRVAAFAGAIAETARAGDDAAQLIVSQAAHSLATLAASVRRSLFLEHQPVAFSYTGGVFRNTTILERFRLLIELEDGNRVQAPLYAPPAGALIEAYKLAGVACTLKNIPEEQS